MKKILFVCLGNICRSPAAEGVLIKKLKDQQITSIEVDSAGTSGFHSGEWPDQRMIDQAIKRGIKLPSRSRKIEAADFKKFDLILCMDKSNLQNVKALSGALEFSDKIKLYSEYKVTQDFLEVPDPYYGSLSDFDLDLDIVDDFANGLIKRERLNE
jgi:protein-tyrosine phosphatase